MYELIYKAVKSDDHGDTHWQWHVDMKKDDVIVWDDYFHQAPTADYCINKIEEVLEQS